MANVVSNQAIYFTPATEKTLTQKESTRSKGFVSVLSTCAYDVSVCANMQEIKKLKAIKTMFIDIAHWSDCVDIKGLSKSFGAKKLILVGASDSSTNFELDALKQGFVGVFYKKDSLDLTLKGIQQIQAGKLWYKRATMESMVKELLPLIPKKTKQTSADTVIQAIPSPLTARERTIVDAIQHGAKNQEIAESLSISLNTVKTHIYSIFRKTNCRNRVELITWAMRNGAVSAK